ncbi:unnamed protein product [Pleuronectes platessa]|uniref:Uncharacterized protein n=1 Tax=Pleuronectes platessa TaxID=8262 RepID=A0A9N7TG07_PLEPL|nr:unnamed protein product [Pleuronectes platessa]
MCLSPAEIGSRGTLPLLAGPSHRLGTSSAQTPGQGRHGNCHFRRSISEMQRADSWKAQPAERLLPGCRGVITLLPNSCDSLLPSDPRSLALLLEISRAFRCLASSQISGNGKWIAGEG